MYQRGYISKYFLLFFKRTGYLTSILVESGLPVGINVVGTTKSFKNASLSLREVSNSEWHIRCKKFGNRKQRN